MTREEILKVKGPRVHKITNSYGVYDMYKQIRKNNWYNIGKVVKEKDFYAIIRTVNNLLVANFLKGKDIVFPYRMGTLELRKNTTKVKYTDKGLLVTAPIDWNSTLKLWCEDEDARSNKQLVRVEDTEIYKVFYNKATADFENKFMYELRPNRELKKNLKKNIKKGILDAFLVNNYNDGVHKY